MLRIKLLKNRERRRTFDENKPKTVFKENKCIGSELVRLYIGLLYKTPYRVF
jgi:hypothetical protein